MLCLFISLSRVYFTPAGSAPGPSEDRLIMDLFEKYNKYSRPVKNENESLEVNFGISLQQIIDVVRLSSPQTPSPPLTLPRPPTP